MQNVIPPIADIRTQLLSMRYAQLDRLAALSGTKLRTLIKIRAGETANPGIETVRTFHPFIEQVLAEATQPAALS